jgi:hypothetical protein
MAKMINKLGLYTYKGHNIEKVERWGQIFFVVDDCYEAVYFSMADARRAVNGELTKWQPVSL